MRTMIAVALAAGAYGCCGIAAAQAADFSVQPQAAAPDYGPPPVAEGYAYPPPPPPPVAYGYPPPPPPDYYAYDVPPYAVWPGPYYGPYWRGGPSFAYGYGHWRGRGRWGRGWHR